MIIDHPVKVLFVAVLGGCGAIAMLAAMGLIGAIPIYFLWNWLMPAIFSIKAITFWQAWGVYWLAGILFKDMSSTSKKSD